MDDDFNTPQALAAMQGAARELNSAKAAGDLRAIARCAASLRSMGAALGVLQQEPEKYLRRSVAGQRAGAGALADAEIEALLDARRSARGAKNFAESDRIRAQLSAAGILLDDKPGGVTQWRRQ
jgi:cysteinyl-tRNA synthetase